MQSGLARTLHSQSISNRRCSKDNATLGWHFLTTIFVLLLLNTHTFEHNIIYKNDSRLSTRADDVNCRSKGSTIANPRASFLIGVETNCDSWTDNITIQHHQARPV